MEKMEGGGDRGAGKGGGDTAVQTQSGQAGTGPAHRNRDAALLPKSTLLLDLP